MGEIGSWLVRAREARGLTLEDAERDTRISRRYLQALESEQFDVIPAPVYARGFLRSYSQYLGLDPQELLALFPRDDDPAYSPPSSPPVREQPVSAVGPARPTWRRPPREKTPAPARRPSAGPQQEMSFEPTIGVDIGVATPTRRIKTDPAAQTRSLTVLVVAIGAIAAVLLLAFLISKVGGDDDPASSPGPAAKTTTTVAQQTPTQPAGASGLDVTPGVVPDVEGKPVAQARLAIAEAGFEVSEKHQKDARPKGTVIQQSPAPGIEKATGVSTVIIVVSDGP